MFYIMSWKLVSSCHWQAGLCWVSLWGGGREWLPELVAVASAQEKGKGATSPNFIFRGGPLALWSEGSWPSGRAQPNSSSTPVAPPHLFSNPQLPVNQHCAQNSILGSNSDVFRPVELCKQGETSQHAALT